MMKKILVMFCCFFSISVMACPDALPTNDSEFCASFRTAAVCYCTVSGLPAGKCQNMSVLYKQMMIRFGSLQRACEYQHYTSVQECMDNWTCYLVGGVDSQGRLCSSTKNACQ